MLHLDGDWLAHTLTPAAWARLAHTQVRHDAPAYAALCQLSAVLFATATVAAKQAALARFVRFIAHTSTMPAPPPATSPSPEIEPKAETQAVAQARALIDAHPADRTALPALAAQLGLSERRLATAFRRATGMTPHAYRLDARVRLARRLLGAGQSAADVALDAGFFDQSHLVNVFRQHVATTPGAYQRRR